MRGESVLAMMLSGALACATSLWCQQERGRVQHHHELRGAIVRVEPEKNQFIIAIAKKQEVVCVVDSKTVVKRDNRTITLGDVRAGERARCHCAAIRHGKHYSRQLLIESR